MSTQINLLPKPLRQRIENRLRLTQWLPVWIGAAGLLSLGQIAIRHSLASAEVAQRVLVDRTLPVRAIQQHIDTAVRNTAELQASLDRQSEVEQSDTPLVLLQLVVAACAQAGEIELQQYEMIETPTPEGKVVKRLSLRGQAGSDAAVSHLVQQLRETPVLARVDLEGSQSLGGEQSSKRTFRLVCEQAPARRSKPLSEGAS